MRCQGFPPRCARHRAHEWRGWLAFACANVVGASLAVAKDPLASLTEPATVGPDHHVRWFITGVWVTAPCLVGFVWWLTRKRVGRLREQLGLKEQREQLIPLSRVV